MITTNFARIYFLCGKRWTKTSSGEWVGVIRDAAWKLKQSDSHLYYQVFQSEDCKHVISEKSKGSKSKCYGGKSDNFSKPNEIKKHEKHIADVSEEHSMPTYSLISAATVKQERTDNSISTVKQEGKGTTVDAIVSTPEENPGLDNEIILKDYLQLDVNLGSLYTEWATADKHFEDISKHFPGIRILRQDPVECLFSFICSSNNNITRITSMVEKLACHYGRRITQLDGRELYTFPQVSALAVDGVEEKLRALGFGYRAKYIQTSARYIQERGGEEWLVSLRDLEYAAAKAQLIKLCGVGAKVADCVALFCLDQPGAIPVDTHVWQIAACDYIPKLKQAKSLTDKLYQEIGDHFRGLWGPYAGWAHSVLFTADLKQFKNEKTPEKKIPVKRKESPTVETKGRRKKKK